MFNNDRINEDDMFECYTVILARSSTRDVILDLASDVSPDRSQVFSREFCEIS